MLAQEGKIEILCAADRQGSMIDCRCKLTAWKWAKSPTAMLQETTRTQHAWVYRDCTWAPGNNPDATCMSIPRLYLEPCCTCDVYVSVSNLVTTELLSLGWRIGTGYWVCWMLTGGKTVLTYTASSSVEHTASSSVEHVVQVTAERRLFFGHVSHTDIRLK